jgi:16S rRNA (guanine966-N2)-methyltransferase
VAEQVRPTAAVHADDEHLRFEHVATLPAGGSVADVRVVAGSARGRQLTAPPGRDTRPTADRVREAMFNALTSLDLVVGARVVDLFAGSGALGIEALSRGAAHCTFVESDWGATAAIHANLNATGLARQATVSAGRVDTWLYANAGATYDLALADPPYVFDDWPSLLSAVPAPFLVAETGRDVALPDTPAASWERVRERRYGVTVVTFLRRLAP